MYQKFSSGNYQIWVKLQREGKCIIEKVCIEKQKIRAFFELSGMFRPFCIFLS